MKKWILTMIAIVLTMGAAQAESTQVPEVHTRMIIKGMESTAYETLYSSQYGYTIWMDDRMKPRDDVDSGYDYFYVPTDDGAPTVSMYIVDSEVPIEEADAFILEATATYPQENVGEVKHVILESGLEYFSQDAVEEGAVYRFYAVKGPEYLLCITGIFPEEDVDGYGERFDQMVQSIEFAEK